MPIAVTGSIATDHLMHFAGRFAEQILPGELDRLSLSFLVEDLVIRRGGVAANIAFGLGVLGCAPLLVGAVGADFGDYRDWLVRHGVDVSGVLVSDRAHTARFVCTSDDAQCQIASFYPGAMTEAAGIELAPLGALELVVVSPNDPAAMRRHTQECRELGLSFAADPSQQLASLDGAQVRELVEGAALLFTNAYERALLESKTGWDGAAVLKRVGVRITTRGADGALIEQQGQPALEVPVVPAAEVADPTGVGDAFRAGFLAARSWGLEPRRCAEAGSMLATFALESIGTQEYAFDPQQALERLAAAYGAAAAAEIGARLPG